MRMNKTLMKNTANPRYDEFAEQVKRFEAEYGEDWEDTRVEYDNGFVSLPLYVFKAATNGSIRTALQWLGKGSIKERVNAKCEDAGNASLLWAAARNNRHDLMSHLLLNGVDVNILDSSGASVLAGICFHNDSSKSIRFLLSWGAELFIEGKQVTKGKTLALCEKVFQRSDAATAQLLSSELGGRRCEIVSVPSTRVDLVGKTCVVEEYLEGSDQHKVKMEFPDEVLLLGADCLKRRDRTPQDPGYYVEGKNNRLIRRDFKSNDECQAFIANISAYEEEVAGVDPNAEAKAEQAAADLLAELGLEDLEGPSISAAQKEKHSVAMGKKKKRGGKKKGRK